MCCGCYEKWILVWPNFFIAASFFLLDVLFFVATWSLFYKTRLLIKKLTPIYELKLPEKSQLIFWFSRYLAFLWFWISEFNWLFGLSDFIAAILMASCRLYQLLWFVAVCWCHWWCIAWFSWWIGHFSFLWICSALFSRICQKTIH